MVADIRDGAGNSDAVTARRGRDAGCLFRRRVFQRAAPIAGRDRPVFRWWGVAATDIARATSSGLPAFGDLDAMLAVVAADIVDIATPPPGYLAAIRVALKYKLRAIICQKPFCAGLEQACAPAMGKGPMPVWRGNLLSPDAPALDP